LLSIAAVALSVSLLITVSSLFTGFINAFEQSAVQAIGEIVLTPPVKLAKYPQFIEQLKQIRSVKAATATLSAQGLLHLGKGNVKAVKIWGIEPGPRAEVTGFKQALLNQKDSNAPPTFQTPDLGEKIGGFIGIGVIAAPDEKTDEYDFEEAKKMTGQKMVLTTGTAAETEEEGKTQFRRKLVRFIVADIAFTGVYELDKSYVYLPIERLQEKLYPDELLPVADQIQIKLADDADTDVAMAQIWGAWQMFASDQLNWGPGLISSTDIDTAKQMQSQYVAELRKQMWILLVIFGVVSLSVILLVFCIFYMIVRLKQKDIAIIRSCGAPGTSLAWAFLGFGGCVGIAGSALGTAMGYAVTRNINTVEEWIRIIFGLKLWKSSVYMFSIIPNEVNWWWAFAIVLFSIVAAALGALVPAIVAAQTRPVKILRYE